MDETRSAAGGPEILSELLPPILLERPILELALWQWLALLLLLVVAWAVSWLLARILLGALRRAAARSRTDLDDRFLEAAGGPLRLLLGVALFSAASVPLALSEPVEALVLGTAKLLSVVGTTWLALRLIDVFAQRVAARLEASGGRPATSVVPLGRRATKVAVVALAALAGLDSFGFDVTALIAGLGVGGIAVALAAQKTVENLFGGVTLIADRPVRVGDFCRFGDRVGTIEEIGLRSTCVRTPDRTLVTVPNAEFATLQLENFAPRDKILFNPSIGLRYETTPEQLRYVLVEIRRVLYAHPRVDPDPARVRFVGFGAYSLDIDIFAYVRTADYADFLGVAEDLNLRIMDVVEAAGSDFAFPSSTTYVARDAGVDLERGREAEEAVRDWREHAELFLPAFPERKVEELAGTIPYPPEGSPREGG